MAWHLHVSTADYRIWVLRFPNLERIWKKKFRIRWLSVARFRANFLLPAPTPFEKFSSSKFFPYQNFLYATHTPSRLIMYKPYRSQNTNQLIKIQWRQGLPTCRTCRLRAKVSPFRWVTQGCSQYSCFHIPRSSISSSWRVGTHDTLQSILCSSKWTSPYPLSFRISIICLTTIPQTSLPSWERNRAC